MPTIARRILILALLVIWTLGASQASYVLAEESSIRLQDSTQAKCYAVLRQAIDSDEFWPSMHAAEAMTLAGKGNEVRQRLESKLEEEEDDQRRCGLARELVRAGDREKVSILFGILASKNPHGHIHACESLFKVGEVGDKRLLRLALRQPEDETKALMAAAALGRFGDTEALALVRRQIEHSDSEIARMAAWVLARIGAAQDIPLLRAQAEQYNDPLTRAYFDHALAALGANGGLQALEKNLSSSDPQIRTYAATFAVDARATFAHDRLIELLEDENLDVRIRAAQSLLVLSKPALKKPSALDLQKPTSQRASATDTQEEREGLGWIDWVIIVLYATATIGLGWYYGRKQRTTEEYFVGSGNMNWMLIGISLFATLLSTISYLSIPGEIISKGPMLFASVLSFPFVYLVVGYILLPIYMRRRVTSAYELLETNLGLSIRMLGVSMFLVMRLVWMSLLVYLSAKAMTVMMNVDKESIPVIVLAIGTISVIYTSLGGLRAVVITDLFQTILLFLGALMVIATITYDFGGFGWFPTEWQANWDQQPIFSFDPKVRVTVVGTILSMFTWYVCSSGGDQVVIQRFMATKDATAARRALAMQLLVFVAVLVVLSLVGVALLGYFQAHADLLPEGKSLVDNADDIFPSYIAFHLPTGVAGLVVAAMFAAAMSSIDSGVNSITAVVMTDLLDRFGRTPKNEKSHLRISRFLAFSIGAVVVLGSSFMEQIPGNITTVTRKTTDLLVTPLFGLFFFALFVPNARPAAVWIGWVGGMATAFLIAFSGTLFGFDPVTGYDPVSFMWIGPASLAVNIAVGLGANVVLTGLTPHRG